MTKVNCPLSGCNWNDCGECSLDEINLCSYEYDTPNTTLDILECEEEDYNKKNVLQVT